MAPSLSRTAALVAGVALSGPVTALTPRSLGDDCTKDIEPFQVRLSYFNATSMGVSWNTNASLSNPTVYFGTGSTLDQSASSSISITYPTSSTWSNHVVITGLTPNTRYHYEPSCGHRGFSFTTAREVGDGHSFKFAMVGDMGTFGPDGLSTTVGTGAKNPLKPGDTTTVDALHSAKTEFDFLWHVGDIAYADSWVKEETGGYLQPLNLTDHGAVYDRILNDFYNQIEPISRDVPYMVLPGNHEANCDNGSNLTLCVPGQLNFTGFRMHWNMPAAPSGGLGPMWNSWDHGMVHFINFNTETDFPNAPDEPGGEGAENAGPFAPPGTQLAWLEADLAAVNRSKTPWVIVAGHRPWYVSDSKCTECQAAFEPLFLKYGVDVVLHGHKHYYERQSAVGANGTAQEIGDSPTAPWYIVNGAGGHYDGLDTPKLPLVATSRKVVQTYGWSLFTVHNCTHLTTEFVASGNGSVMDTATLVKQRGCDVFDGGH